MGMFENFKKYKETFTVLEEFEQEFTAREFNTIRDKYWSYSSYGIASLNTLREHGFIIVTRKEYIIKSDNTYSYKGEPIAANIYRKMPRDFQKMCEVTPISNPRFSDKFVRNYYTVSWDRVHVYLDEYDKFCNNIETEIYPLLDEDFRMAKDCVKEFRWALNNARTKLTKLCWDTEWRYWDNEINKTR